MREQFLEVLKKEIELIESWIEDITEDKTTTYLIEPMTKRRDELIEILYKTMYPNIETFTK